MLACDKLAPWQTWRAPCRSAVADCGAPSRKHFVGGRAHIRAHPPPLTAARPPRLVTRNLLSLIATAPTRRRAVQRLGHVVRRLESVERELLCERRQQLFAEPERLRQQGGARGGGQRVGLRRDGGGGGARAAAGVGRVVRPRPGRSVQKQGRLQRRHLEVGYEQGDEHALDLPKNGLQPAARLGHEPGDEHGVRIWGTCSSRPTISTRRSIGTRP